MGASRRAAERAAPAPVAHAVGTPWLVVGGIGLVLAAVGAFLLLDRGRGAPVSPASSSASPGPGVSGASSGGSAGTPQETASSLFNRVMMASESGDRAEAERLAPRAIDAYRRLGALDNDGRYHLGLLLVTAGQLDEARAEREAVRRSNPDHLLGIMLEQAIAEAAGDAEGVARAYEAFRGAYTEESSTGRREYSEHGNGIRLFLEEASRAVP